jgi:Tfp pilus assembly protein PilX
MGRAAQAHRGVALYIVVGTIMTVAALAFVISKLIVTQSRITQHQVNRTRAYYALVAGMNLAIDRIRKGSWTAGNTYTLSNVGTPTIRDADIPYPVSIAIANAPAVGTPVSGVPGAVVITLSTDYSYTE